MSEFPRIDPNHPLTVAARDVNSFAEEHGIEMTLDWLGMDVSPAELAYLSEQRALRAVSASMGHNLGGDGASDQLVAAALVASPFWQQYRMLLISCVIDGLTIGYRAATQQGDDE